MTTQDTSPPPLTYHELHLWALQMNLMLVSGMPLHSGLELLAASEDLPTISWACDHLADDIGQGKRLSESMRGLKPTFSDFVVNLVAVGENSGRLAEVFSRISQRALQRGKTEQTVRSALAYPTMLTVVSGAMAGFMAFYMFPKMLPFLMGLNVELPWPTRALIWGTHHLGWLILLFTVLAGWLGYILTASSHPRALRVRDWLLYRSPILGRLNRHRVYADCLADLHLLVEAQCSLVGSLRCLKPPWEEQKERIRTCVREIETGSSLTDAVATSGMLPPFFLAPLSSAEETGAFSKTFRMLSEQLDEAVLMELERLLQVLEPLLLASMGLVIGFVVLASFLPLYSLTSSL